MKPVYIMLRAFVLLGLAYGSTAFEATTTTSETTHTTTTTTLRETATAACKLTRASTIRTINFHDEFEHPEVVLKHAAAHADELSPGKGYVVQQQWEDHPPFNILLENGHAWEVVNCTETFAVDTPESESCLPHDYALSYRPAMGTFPIGIIGTTGYTTFPRPGSPWGAFDLQSIVVTPFDGKRNLTGVPIMVSIYMWVLSDEGFLYPLFHDQAIIGGLPQYEIKLDDGALPIAKFQVLAWETNREKEAPTEGASDPPKTLGMILHSMSVNEFTNGTEICPISPAPGTNNELFRKISIGKDLQQFEDNNLKLDFDPRSRLMTAQAKNFFFAVNSLKLQIDRDIPENERLRFGVQSYDTCGNIIPQSDPFIKWDGGRVEITFVHEGHRHDKVFKMEIMIPENIWEPKELEVREWFDVLGLSGCHPCAEDNQKHCELPAVRRLLVN